MNTEALIHAARLIVEKNVTDNVFEASAIWNSSSRHLCLTYLFAAEPDANDTECQELAMTELLAEFPDVVTAECKVALIEKTKNLSLGKIYARNV